MNSNKSYQNIYNAKPDVKARRKAYNATLKVKVYQKAYNDAHKKELKAYQKASYIAHKEERRAYQKAYRDKPENKLKKKEYDTKPEIIAYQKAYRAKSETKRLHRTFSLEKNYKISDEEYNKIFNAQNGCCAICGKHQSEFKKALFVDHDHLTDKVRGLLCHKCNAALGLLNDNIDLLKLATNYLENNKN